MVTSLTFARQVLFSICSGFASRSDEHINTARLGDRAERSSFYLRSKNEKVFCLDLLLGMNR